MKLVINNVEFLLDKTKDEIALKLQNEIDNIFLLAKLLGYKVDFGYNSFDKVMLVILKKIII